VADHRLRAEGRRLPILKRQALVLAPLLILAGVALAVPAGQETGPRDAQAVLRQVRQVYDNLTAYRFEHRIRIDQTPVDGAQESVADVTLTTVTQRTNAAGGRGQARAEGGGKPSEGLLASMPPFDDTRCRVESATDNRRLLLVSGDGSTTLFSSARMEYMKGATVRDVALAAASSILLAVHLMPLALPAGLDPV
jgi:hypothetical protein